LIDVGHLVTVKVTKISSYGIEIDYKGSPGLIQVLELSWDIYGLQSRLKQFCEIGDLIEVVVLSVTDTVFYASLKQVRPDLNPWSEENIVVVGDNVSGRVLRVADYGGVIKLKNGSVAILPHEVLSKNRELVVGEEIFVEVKEVDEAKKLILVE